MLLPVVAREVARAEHFVVHHLRGRERQTVSGAREASGKRGARSGGGRIELRASS